MREVASGKWRVLSGKWILRSNGASPLGMGGVLVSSGGWRAFCLAVFAGCFLCGMAWAVSICGSCGYENGDDARFCSHCGGGIGKEQGERKPEASAQADAPVQNVVSAGAIAIESVKAEMREAQKYAKRGHVELGDLFARNAFALNMLAGTDHGKRRSKAMIKFFKLCEVKAKSGRRDCPECRGSGKAVMSAHTLGDRTIKFEAAGMRCKRCGGSGKISGKLTMDERKYRIGTAIEEYRTLQNSRGMVPEGLVWLPAESADGLDVRQRVVLKRALPPVCSHCMGLGRIDCSTCKGDGVVECRAKDCRNGYVESESDVNRLGGSSFRSERAGVRAKCAECGGSGVISCKKCSGVGSFLCKYCNGSGRAEICEKCRGKGLVLCRRCGGSGVYRDKACPYCREAGSIECSSCGGTGRRQ